MLEWRWGLDVCLAALENKQKVPSGIDLHKKLVAEVKPDKKWYKERVYNCSHCSTSIDRDLNASLNLLNYASTPSSGGIDACGEVKPLESVAFETWMKQAASMSLFDLAV